MNSICEYIANFAKIQPQKVALIEKEKEVNYEELHRYMCGFCEYLKGQGIRKGNIIVCRASASINYWICFLGTLLAGGVFVPLEKDCVQEKIESIINSFEGVFALISNKEDEETSFNSKLFIDIKKAIDIATQNNQENREYEYPTYEDDAVVLFTTGTTGTSKGVLVQQKYLVEMAFRTSKICHNEDIRIILPLPMNHVMALGRAIATWLHGGMIIILDGLTDLKQFFQLLLQYEVNALVFVPSALNYIIALMGEEITEYFTNVKMIELGGEKMPYQLQETLLRLFPNIKLYIEYASTETCISCIYELSKYGATKNRIGIPIDKTEIILVDEDWKEIEASPENPGFIAVKSDSMMKSYWNDLEATDKIKQGNMIVMSDYGYIDEEGFVCLLGRAGDVIISGGQKINPTEVEDCALKSGFISDCVCFGKKNDLFGNTVNLIVVMKVGMEYDENRMKTYLTENLEYFKVPKEISCAEKIQRNRNGKIDRKYYTK